VLGPLVRVAVSRHVRVNVKALRSVLVGATGAVERWCPEDRPAQSAIAEAMEKVQKFAQEIKESEDGDTHPSSKLLDGAFDLFLKTVVPAGSVSTLFWTVARSTYWILIFGWVVLYHILGLVGILIHDSEHRKELLFEGYIGTPSDGVKPLFPNVSRVERALYEHLGVSPPVVVAWGEVVWPGVHYGVTTAAVIASGLIWWHYHPTQPSSNLGVTRACAMIILLYQAAHLTKWFKWVRVRREGWGHGQWPKS
jgi:hypothetical protein